MRIPFSPIHATPLGRLLTRPEPESFVFSKGPSSSAEPVGRVRSHRLSDDRERIPESADGHRTVSVSASRRTEWLFGWIREVKRKEKKER